MTGHQTGCECVLCDPHRPRRGPVCDVGRGGHQEPCLWCENCRRTAAAGAGHVALAWMRLMREYILASNKRVVAEVEAQQRIDRGEGTPEDVAVVGGSPLIACRMCERMGRAWSEGCDEQREHERRIEHERRCGYWPPKLKPKPNSPKCAKPKRKRKPA